MDMPTSCHRSNSALTNHLVYNIPSMLCFVVTRESFRCFLLIVCCSSICRQSAEQQNIFLGFSLIHRKENIIGFVQLDIVLLIPHFLYFHRKLLFEFFSAFLIDPCFSSSKSLLVLLM